MTRAERKEMLCRELDRARDAVSPAIYNFARLCERAPAPRAAALARAARAVYLKTGKVVGLATLLAREGEA